MKIPGGYILQPRIFDESEAAHLSPVTRELWFYLLRRVNYSDNGQYKRGQGFFQFHKIQEDLSWFVGYRKMTYSKPQITKALRRLCEGNMTATAKATRGLVITVCNYNDYQCAENYEGNDEGSTKVARRDSGGHTKNKKLEEVKKEKKKKKDPSPEALRLSGIFAELILKNNPENRQLSNGNSKTSIKRWAYDIDKMNRIDGRTWDRIERCIAWSQASEFWHRNIVSGEKLRKQYDTMALQAKSESDNAGTHGSAPEGLG